MRYEEIAEGIKLRFVHGRRPGDRLPPIRQLMEHFEVSQATVTHSLEFLEGAGWVKRISGRGYFIGAVDGESAAAGGGAPRERAKSSESRLFQIDFCSFLSSASMVTSPLYSRMLLHLMAEANACNTILNAFNYDEMGSLDAFREKIEHSPARACILLGCNRISFEHVLRELKKPHVHLYPDVLDGDMNALVIDNAAAMRQLMQPLIAAGHTRIAMIHGQGDNGNFHLLDQQERLEAYYEVMREHRLPTIGRSVVFGGFTPERGYAAAKELLEVVPEFRPTALLCNDGNVEGVYQAIAEGGLRIPDDISVVGFDNGDNIRRLQPALTTVDIHWARAIEAALTTAIGLTRPQAQTVGTVRLPVEYIGRNSIGPAPRQG